MAKRKGKHLQRFRQPEGGLPVQAQHLPVADGSLLLTIDLSKAPVPERRYVADVAGVLVSDDIVHLLFGQAQIVGSGLRTMLDIHVPAQGIRHFLDSFHAHDMPNTLSTLRQKLGYEGRGLYNITEEPKETFALPVNLIATAVTSREACLDMYYADTFVISKAVRGIGDFKADPVVRISLPSAVLLGVIAKLESLRDSLPENV